MAYDPAVELGPEWIPVEWRNDGTRPAFVHNWQVWIKLPALIEAVERQGYIVTPVEGEE